MLLKKTLNKTLNSIKQYYTAVWTYVSSMAIGFNVCNGNTGRYGVGARQTTEQPIIAAPQTAPMAAKTQLHHAGGNHAKAAQCEAEKK